MLGHSMTLTAGGLTVGRARDVNLSLDSDLADTTTRDTDGWKDFEQGLKEWSIDVEQLYVSNNAAMRTIIAAYIGGTKLAVVLTDTDGNADSGQVLVQNIKRGEPLGDSVTLQCTLKGCGALTSALPDS